MGSGLLSRIWVTALLALLPGAVANDAYAAYDNHAVYDGFRYNGALVPMTREIQGFVLGRDSDTLRIAGESLTAEDDITVHIGGAVVYDLLTGFPAYTEDICTGMPVRVAYEPSEDNGIAQAETIWIHYGEDGAAAFEAVVSENIQYDDDACTFMTGDGKYRVTLTADTFIFDPDDGFVSPYDIRPGQSLFIWVEMVTASYPAQAYPDKAALVRMAIPVTEVMSDMESEQDTDPIMEFYDETQDEDMQAGGFGLFENLTE